MNNNKYLSFEFFGNVKLPYSKKYPYKLNKHTYFFKKNLQNNKIDSKFFTIEFLLMHWVEYYYFVHSKLPTNKEMKDKI